MNLAGLLLRLTGWKVSVTVPDFKKCIICVAPHTSNWDFVLGKLAYWHIGRKAGFLMKDFWFFFPLSYALKAMDGIPVSRKGAGNNLTEYLIDKFNNSEQLCLAITPEGTRKRVTKWHSGMIRIAYGAKIPIVLAKFDFKEKEMSIHDVFNPTGDIEKDLQFIKNYYKGVHALHPENFTTDDE